MRRRLFCSSVLLAAVLSAVGCRKTEVVAAPPEHVVTPQPTVIEHDRPVIIEQPR